MVNWLRVRVRVVFVSATVMLNCSVEQVSGKPTPLEYAIRFRHCAYYLLLLFFSSWGSLPLQSCRSLFCDHGLHCSHEFMWGQQQDRSRFVFNRCFWNQAPNGPRRRLAMSSRILQCSSMGALKNEKKLGSSGVLEKKQNNTPLFEGVQDMGTILKQSKHGYYF